MNTLFHSIARAVASFATMIMLVGCIGSPFPAGAVAELYRWDDLDSPVATRIGQSSTEFNGYFDGDFSFWDLLLGQTLVDGELSAPWLLRACYEDICYAAVLFADIFELNGEQVLSGYASLTGISTAMANQVRNLPSSEVRYALDNLAAKLLADGDGDYSMLLELDPARRLDHREKLVSKDLFLTAETVIAKQPNATVDVLLGKAETTTKNIAVPDGFLFDGSQSLSVDVDLSSRLSEDAYLLICSEFEATMDGYEVDFSACQLSTLLRGGSYSGMLSLTDSVEDLLAIILPLQDPSQADYYVWARDLNGGTFSVR